jgi:large subunit ribosomal protein L31
MKKDIHPQYFDDAKIKCSCGAVLETGSTRKDLQVEICSQCHPFYTGKKKVMDSTGRVDRFKKLTERTSAKKEATQKALAERKAEMDKKKAEAKKPAKKKVAKK